MTNLCPSICSPFLVHLSLSSLLDISCFLLFHSCWGTGSTKHFHMSSHMTQYNDIRRGHFLESVQSWAGCFLLPYGAISTLFFIFYFFLDSWLLLTATISVKMMPKNVKCPTVCLEKVPSLIQIKLNKYSLFFNNKL